MAELTEGEGLSNREAAAVLGVGEATVRRDREASSNDEVDTPGQIEIEPAPSPNDEGNASCYPRSYARWARTYPYNTPSRSFTSVSDGL